MLNNIIRFSLKNRLLLFVVTIMIMAAGYNSYKKLPIDAFPDVSPNLVQIFTLTDGLAPQEVEKYITFPVESSVAGIPGVENIRSVSNFGLSVVNIYFKDEMSIYFARQLIAERLKEAEENIPEGFGTPEMGPISTGMGMILFYYLEDTTGKYSLEELRTMQDWIVKFNLQTVKGVTEVLGIGGDEKQFQVVINPPALLKFDLTINDIVEKIKKNNSNIGAQFLEKNSEELMIRSVGLAKNKEDIENIVIKNYDGRVVFLKDVANIKIGAAIKRGVQVSDGKGEVVAGQVIKLYGENSSTVIDRVEKRIVKINKMLPSGVKIVPYYQQKDLIQASVNTVTSALLQGILFVMLVLFLFMGSIRPSLVVIIAIPFSVLFTFIGMEYFGISANLMSFGGLAIAIGMMVDGTIVVVENIDRKLREGIVENTEKNTSKNKIRMIMNASFEVVKPVVFAISIIIIVFIPLFSLQGVEGKTFKPLAYTIVFAMLGSLIFAVLLAPMFSSFLMKTPKAQKEKVKDSFIANFKNRLLNIYGRFLFLFIKFRALSVVLAVFLLLLGGFLFTKLGTEFTPELKEGNLMVRLTLSPSIALTESIRITTLVEKRLLTIKQIKKVVTRIGRGEVGAHSDPVNSAEMYVLLDDKGGIVDSDIQEEVEEKIRKKLKGIPGVVVNISQPIEASIDELLEGVKAELSVKLFGDDLGKLKENADKISKLLKTVKGAQDIQVDQVAGAEQLVITPNRDKMSRYGINMEEVQNTIKIAIGGESVGKIFEGVKSFDIFVRYEESERKDKEAIENLIIKTEEGINIPLKEIADISEVSGYRQITRENNQRFITIQCNVDGRDIGSFVAEAQKKIDKEVDLPVGYFTAWGGQFKLQQEANKRLSVVIPITLLIIALLLFLSFNNIKNTILILLNIPLALVGGVVALWVSGQNLSVPATVGFIALFGIALENGMVLVTYLNTLVSEGMEVNKASIEAAKRRIKPVLMTAVTTGLGLIPLLISTSTGSEVQKPLATVVVGGLITSTILTLLVIPSLYKWFSDKPKESSKA